MDEKTIAVDAALEVFEERQAREQRLEALRAHKFTWDEVETLRTRSKEGDQDAARELSALGPFIEASRRRGDFVPPWELSRRDAQALIEARGVSGPVWSVREVAAIGRDPELFKEYGSEANAALASGQVITGPDMNKGRTYHFNGEDEKTFERELNAKLELVDKRRRAEAAIAAARQELGTATSVGCGKPFCEEALRNVWRENSKTYPVERLEGYQTLVDAFLSAGGSLSDIGAIRAIFWRTQ